MDCYASSSRASKLAEVPPRPWASTCTRSFSFCEAAAVSSSTIPTSKSASESEDPAEPPSVRRVAAGALGHLRSTPIEVRRFFIELPLHAPVKLNIERPQRSGWQRSGCQRFGWREFGWPVLARIATGGTHRVYVATSPAHRSTFAIVSASSPRFLNSAPLVDREHEYL